LTAFDEKLIKKSRVILGRRLEIGIPDLPYEEKFAFD
jgi:hypothetical protein